MKENWNKIERHLLLVVQLSKDIIDYKDSDLLQDFIDNREYGVAYEWIVSLVSERNLTLDSDAAKELIAAGSLMGFISDSTDDKVE